MKLNHLFNALQERIRRHEHRALLNRAATMFLPAGIVAGAHADPHVRALEEQGNTMLPHLAPDASLRELAQLLSQQPCYDQWRPEIGTFAVENTPADTNAAHIVDAYRMPGVADLANHPLVLGIVSEYLGCKPTIDDILAWWSLPGRPAPKEEQFFHRDNDAVRFVKLFIYLSDVARDDGAHVFVAASHRQNSLLERRRRFQDAEVTAAFGDNAIMWMEGAFGTAFLEDTFGLHKGTVPSRSPRLLLQVRYTSIPSVWATRRTGLPSAHDPYINRYLR